MKKEKTTKSLLGAWVCYLANSLANECEKPMTMKDAFTQAHLTRELLENLGKGKVCFQYPEAGRHVARGLRHAAQGHRYGVRRVRV